MARWSKIATWVGPTVNQGGTMRSYRGVVLHIAQGSYEGTIAWQRNPKAETSSHFIVSKAGAIAQMVDTSRVAWCQAAGNLDWLSIEFAGFVPSPLTDEQVQAAARILADAQLRHKIPLQPANTPQGFGLGFHGMGGAAWGGHLGCPGPAIIRQRPEIIAAAQRIVSPPPTHAAVKVAKSPAWRSTVSGIAERYGWGSNWQRVWNDPRNAELRRRRGKPERIQPGDTIYVPRKEA
jgi:hypothetical protein